MLRLCRGSLLPRTFLTIRQHYASRLTYSTTATATAEVLSEEVAPALLTPQKKHFSSLKGIISEETLKAITVKPFTHETMSAVQEEVLSLLPGISQPYNPENPSQLRDLLVRARTGTGKTLAFLVPTIEARVRQREEAGLLAVKNSGRDFDANIMKRGARQFAMENVGTLIISPTRELATQLANEVLKLSYHHEGFEVRLLCGGNSKQKQMKEWYKGSLDFVVATPGRLLDCLRSEPMVAKAIANTQTIILDEADTLLEMGFRDDLDGILRFLPKTPQRQTFMFSATVSPQVQAISRTFLNKEYKYINCVDDTKPTHLSIPQFATTLPSAKHQIPHILKLIAHDQLANPAGRSKIILFLPTTKLTQLFASFMRKLSRDVLPCGKHTEVIEIHSKLSQQMRSKASDQFRNARGASILVTSDVSARGVDYPRVTRVIQVGIPSSKEQYVHRIGRTGRGSNLQGRGDLILQPFEVGFLSWQLTEIPLKSLTTKQLDTALMELVDKYDAEPEKYFAGSGSPMFKHPLKPLMEVLDSSVTSLMALLDPIAVRETHLSSLGYYLPKAPDLRVAKNVILEGLNGWTTEACGLSEPPYVSRGFLNEMGLGDSKSKRYGQDQRRPSAGKAPWAGRGHVMPRGREIVGDNYSDSIENVSEYKTSRYSRKPVVAEDEGSEYGDSRSSYGSGDRRSSYGSGDRRSSHGSGDRRSSYGSGDRRPSYGSREGGSSYGIRNGGGSSRAGGRSFSREGDSPYKRTEGGTPSWERR